MELEEVKKYFENAETIKDHHGDTLHMKDINAKGIYKAGNCFYVSDKKGICLTLWLEERGFAKIIKTKNIKINEKLIEQLRNGEIDVENSGSFEELVKVLSISLGRGVSIPGNRDFYYLSGNYVNFLRRDHVKAVKVQDFFKTEENPLLYKHLGVKKSQKEWEDFLGYSIEGLKTFELVEEFVIGEVVIGYVGEIQYTGLYNGIKNNYYLIKNYQHDGGDIHESGAFTGVRKATLEEIEQYKNPELPHINRYNGTYDKGTTTVKYGCAELYTGWFARSENRYIKSFVLSSGVEITEENVKDIRKYLENIK